MAPAPASSWGSPRNHPLGLSLSSCIWPDSRQCLCSNPEIKLNSREATHLPGCDHQGAVEHTRRGLLLQDQEHWQKLRRQKNLLYNPRVKNHLQSTRSPLRKGKNVHWGPINLLLSLLRKSPTLITSSAFCSGPSILSHWCDVSREAE